MMETMKSAKVLFTSILFSISLLPKVTPPAHALNLSNSSITHSSQLIFPQNLIDTQQKLQLQKNNKLVNCFANLDIDRDRESNLYDNSGKLTDRKQKSPNDRKINSPFCM
jgi:hypothetical protein